MIDFDRSASIWNISAYLYPRRVTTLTDIALMSRQLTARNQTPQTGRNGASRCYLTHDIHRGSVESGSAHVVESGSATRGYAVESGSTNK